MLSDQEDRQLGRAHPAEGAARAARSSRKATSCTSSSRPSAGFKLSPYDPKHAKAMEIARRSFRKYADTLQGAGKVSEPQWLDTIHRSRCPCRAAGARSAEPTEFAISGCSNRRWGGRSTNSRTARPISQRLPLPMRSALREIIRSSTATSEQPLRRSSCSSVSTGSISTSHQRSATAMILALAAGEISEDGLARWIRDNLPKS